MLIGKNAVVSLEVELSDIWGNVIDKPSEPVDYLHGGYGDIFPAVEAALEGKGERHHAVVRLEPQDAFGDYDDSLLQVVPRDRFPGEIEAGMRVETSEGGESRISTITDIADDKIVLDGNHPLAGIALQFSCTVVGIRQAREDEIASGSAEDRGNVIMRVLP